MAFMIPVYSDAPFVRVSDEDSGTGDDYWPLVPAGHETGPSHPAPKGWYARLSAPGYLDCTEWAGPFPTLEKAKAYIADTYDVDPETGDDAEGAL
jgi:hypothetical protein